jgi:hypothetical protein
MRLDMLQRAILPCEQHPQANESLLPRVFANKDLEIRPARSSERVQATFDVVGIAIGDN